MVDDYAKEVVRYAAASAAMSSSASSSGTRGKSETIEQLLDRMLQRDLPGTMREFASAILDWAVKLPDRGTKKAASWPTFGKYRERGLAEVTVMAGTRATTNAELSR